MIFITFLHSLQNTRTRSRIRGMYFSPSLSFFSLAKSSTKAFLNPVSSNGVCKLQIHVSSQTIGLEHWKSYRNEMITTSATMSSL